MKFPSLLRVGLLSWLAFIVPTTHAADSPSSSFILEIRNSQIMDNGKPVGPATVGDVFDYLRKKNFEFNVALGPGVAEATVGNVLLHIDTVDSSVICPALCQAIVTSANQHLRTAPIDPEHSNVYGIVAEKQEHEVAVFNLTSYLNPNGDAADKAVQEKLAAVTDIIFKTLKDADPTFSDAVQPHYQFHQGANLLVVTGSQQAIDVATKVIDALMPSSNPFSSPTSAPATWSNPTPIAGAAGTFLLLPTHPGSVPSGVSVPQTVPTLPGAISVGGDSSSGSRKALDLSLAAANRVQLQAMMNALQQAKTQGSLSPEQLKQFQQHIDELNKMMQDMDQQVKALQNNTPVIIPDVSLGGSSSGSP